MNKIFCTLVSLFIYLSTQAQTQTSGREIYRATPTMHTQLKHTKLKVSLNFDNQTLNGEEWLTASPYFYPSDTITLNAKSMLIHEVALAIDGKNLPLKHTYKNDFLRINLDKKYHKGQEYTLYIKYTAQPEKVPAPNQGGINDVKGLYFINPKGEKPNVPVQVWTQGETESSSCWFPTIDKPNQKTTQEIYITVPDKYVTLSNGLLASSQKQSDGQRTDYWVMDKPHAPYLFFLGAGDFKILKDTPWRGKVNIDYYVEAGREYLAKKFFHNTPEMVEFFSKRFGYDYPWQKYSQIIVREFVSGAMENTTAVSFSDIVNASEDKLNDENSEETTIAHELAHHWFGDLVTTESWANLTVNESFANYSEYLWLEYKYGKDVADKHLERTIENYHYTRDNFHKKLVRFGYEDKEDMFDRVSYNKGGNILHMLRDYLGDEAFFLGISTYLKDNEYSTGEAHQLRLAFEKVSGKDLNWFFNQWYFSNGHPVLKITPTYEPTAKKVKIEIEQTQSQNLLFEFPLEIDVYHDGKYERHSVWVEAKDKNFFHFPVNKEPNLVDINPRGVIILSEEASYKNADQYLFQYKNAKDYKSRSEAISYAVDTDYKPILYAAMHDKFFRLRQKALQGLIDTKIAAKEIANIEKIAKTDPENLVRAAAINVLRTLKNKKYLPIYEKGLTTPSAAIKAASVSALADINPKKVAQYLESVDVLEFGEEEYLQLIPIIAQNNIEKHAPAISVNTIFYPFVSLNNNEKGEILKKGFEWVMKLDNMESIKKITTTLSHLKKEITNPTAKDIVYGMLIDAVYIKKELLKQNPDKESIKEQIQLLEESKKLYK